MKAMIEAPNAQQRRARAGSFDRFIPVRDPPSLAAASFKMSSPRVDDGARATSAHDVFHESVLGDANNNDSPSKTYKEFSGDYGQRMALLAERAVGDNILSFRPRQRSGSWNATGYGVGETTKLPRRQLPSSPARRLEVVTGLNRTTGDCSRLFDINCHGRLAMSNDDDICVQDVTQSDSEFKFSRNLYSNVPASWRRHQSQRAQWCVQWSPTGTSLAVGGGPLLMLMDAELHTTACAIASSPPSCLDWSRHCLSAGFRDGTIQVCDIRSGLSSVDSFTGRNRPSISAVTMLRYSTDGGLLACGTADGQLVIWDTRHRGKPQHEVEAHSDAVGAMAWCPSKPWYVTTGGRASDQTIRIWNVYTGVVNKSMMVGSEVTSLAWCEQSSELVSSHGNPSGEANIRVWKPPQMHLVGEMRCHEGPVWQVELTLEGSKLVSAGSDNLLCVWDFYRDTGSVLSPQGTPSRLRRRASTFTSPGKSPRPIASPVALGGIR